VNHAGSTKSTFAPEDERFSHGEVVLYTVEGEGRFPSDMEPLHFRLEKLDSTVWRKLVARKCIDPVPETDEPALFGVVRSSFSTYAKALQRGHIEGSSSVKP